MFGVTSIFSLPANPNLSDDMNDSDEYDDDYEYEDYDFVYGYPGLSDWRSHEAYSEQCTKLPSTVYQYPKHFYTKVQEEESVSLLLVLFFCFFKQTKVQIVLFYFNSLVRILKEEQGH